MSGLFQLRSQRVPSTSRRGRDETLRDAGVSAPGLIEAMAAVLGIVAERALRSGDFAALREAVERVLDSAGPQPMDPRDHPTADLPRIGDADVATEEQRLRDLLARMPRR